MKKILAMFVFALAFACVIGCGKKETVEEPMPVVTVSEAPAVVETPVAPNVLAAQQKYLAGLKQFDKADYKGALKTWEECLKLDPKNEDCQAGKRAAEDMIYSLAAARK